MTSRELVIRTLNRQPVARAPRDLWLAPGVQAARPDEVAEINARFPSDFAAPEFKPLPSGRAADKPASEDEYADAWGCAFRASPGDPEGEPRFSPLSDLRRLNDYKPPLEALEPDRFAKVDRGCETTSRFVLARADVRPFERLRMLHGPEATLASLARDGQPIRRLLAAVHDYNCRELELWAGTQVDGVAIRDAWGSAEGLLLSAEIWQERFRPLYREYCEILHRRDKFVFFQSGGNIGDIFGELVEIGVDAIHTDFSAVDFVQLARPYRGRVTFWGGLDREQVLLGGRPDDVRQAVERVRRELDFGSGGAIAQCRWEPGVPLRNIAAFFEKWLLPLPMHAPGIRD